MEVLILTHPRMKGGRQGLWIHEKQTKGLERLCPVKKGVWVVLCEMYSRALSRDQMALQEMYLALQREVNPATLIVGSADLSAVRIYSAVVCFGFPLQKNLLNRISVLMPTIC